MTQPPATGGRRPGSRSTSLSPARICQALFLSLAKSCLRVAAFSSRSSWLWQQSGRTDLDRFSIAAATGRVAWALVLGRNSRAQAVRALCFIALANAPRALSRDENAHFASDALRCAWVASFRRRNVIWNVVITLRLICAGAHPPRSIVDAGWLIVI